MRQYKDQQPEGGFIHLLKLKRIWNQGRSLTSDRTKQALRGGYIRF